MKSTSQPNLETGPSSPETLGLPAESHLSTLSSLLQGLEEASVSSHSADQECQNQLVQIRLGIASGLFAALRAKHKPTAMHCLRVAMGCSSWAMTMDSSNEQRDEVEVASLLHDIGKIGVPDSILRKPGALSHDEVSLMDRHRRAGLEIMSACCASPAILGTIEHSSAWFDGSRNNFGLVGEELPIGARMIMIVDSFDAMTTDHLYRKAMSRERAISELFECAGTQFDPKLVSQFATLYEHDQVKLDARLARRWLQQLSPEQSNTFWQLRETSPLRSTSVGPEVLFQHQLLENMHDGVVFVDENLRIIYWNRGAEQLTGILAGSICDKQWVPDLVYLRDGDGQLVGDQDCPVLNVLRSGSQTFQRLNIKGRHGQLIDVDAHAVPIVDSDGTMQGAALLLHDVSSETTLQERVQKLHEKASRDSLTKVANRAEFDRVHAQFVRTHLEQSSPCSLIMCDVDNFKKINDCFGHQAGDEALIKFAALLKKSCRQGDLVARYGGEEFVLVCADCGNASATERAEHVRREVARMPLAEIGGRSLTASFGVTELQPGDTAETMLRRADRALLQAKHNGRNRVVQLGAGMDEADENKNTIWLQLRRQRGSNDRLIDRHLLTNVPLNVAAEKLRGFVADHDSEFVSIDNNRVVLRIRAQNTEQRRRNDRRVSLMVELTIEERRINQHDGNENNSTPLRTIVHVIMRPQRNRDRRKHAVETARQLLVSLKSYLMAQDCVIEGNCVSTVDNGDRVERGDGSQLLNPLLNADDRRID